MNRLFFSKGFVPGRVSAPVLLLGGLVLLVVLAGVVLMQSWNADEDGSAAEVEGVSASGGEAGAEAGEDRALESRKLPSVGEIEGIESSVEAAEVHFELTQFLIEDLLDLVMDRDREVARENIMVLVERYAALDRQVVGRGLEKPGRKSVPFSAHHDNIETLLAWWSQDPEVTGPIDVAFRDRGLISEHNLAETLNRWINGQLR